MDGCVEKLTVFSDKMVAFHAHSAPDKTSAVDTMMRGSSEDIHGVCGVETVTVAIAKVFAGCGCVKGSA
jgi:hypothetical protein